MLLAQKVAAGAPVVRSIKCLVYSRIVGYYTPIQGWHKGKRREYDDRTTFTKDEIQVASSNNYGNSSFGVLDKELIMRGRDQSTT